MKISETVKYIGVNDHEVDLFEGQYIVPNGMAYNSYAIIDEKIAIMDTVDARFTHEWLDNIQNALGAPLVVDGGRASALHASNAGKCHGNTDDFNEFDH